MTWVWIRTIPKIYFTNHSHGDRSKKLGRFIAFQTDIFKDNRPLKRGWLNRYLVVFQLVRVLVERIWDQKMRLQQRVVIAIPVATKNLALLFIELNESLIGFT